MELKRVLYNFQTSVMTQQLSEILRLERKQCNSMEDLGIRNGDKKKSGKIPAFAKTMLMHNSKGGRI
jgi:hypothetical protein